MDRIADDLNTIVDQYCDIVFCNKLEISSFFQLDDLAECRRRLGSRVELAFVTESANGCYVVQQGTSTHVPGFSVKAIDTVGAGDAFAGGVLYGLTHGWSPIKSARWGNYIAAQVVAKIGPRLDGHEKLNAEQMAAEISCNESGDQVLQALAKRG